MTNINNSKRADFYAKLNYWKQLTNDNMHGEVLMDIALFFDMPEYVNAFFKTLFADHLTMAEYEARCKKADEMLEEIASKYTEYMAEVIKRYL